MEIVNEIPLGRIKGKFLEWADGEIRRLDRGIDFGCRANAYAVGVRAALKRNGLTGIVTARKNSVFIQIDRPVRRKAVGE